MPVKGEEGSDNIDIFIGNEKTHEVHHKNMNLTLCKIFLIRNPVVFGSLTEARRQGYDLCGHCFESKQNAK